MKCAYASAILDAINFALSQNANLFSSTELGSLARVAALPYPCVRVIGRLLTRKVKWVKLASILEYIDELESVEQQDVITALLDGGLLLSLLGQDQFSEVWEVAESSFVSDDWNWLSQRLTGGRPKSGSRKEETIRLVRQTMESQKTCFGTSLKQRFVDSVRSLCRASPGGDWVRLQADISVLLRRVQRLLQAPSDVSGAADVSAFKPLEVCVPLFVTFRLMQLPAYDLFSLHTQAESVLFSDRACFHHWEAAMELRHALVELDLLSHQKDGDLSGTHLKDVLAILSHVACCGSVSRSVASLFERFVSPADGRAPFDGASAGELSQFAVRMFTGIDWASSTSTATEMAQRVGLFGTLLLLAAVAEEDAATPTLPAAGDDEFLLRFRTITQLCGCVAHLAADLEARAVGRHDLALLLYELLLALPPRYGAIFAKKRGAWLKRVLINADVHLKRPMLALSLARRALAAARREPPGGPLALLESDEVDLRDRVRALAQRIEGQQLRQRAVDPAADSHGAAEDGADRLLRAIYAHLHGASGAGGGAEDDASRRRLLTTLVLRELHRLHAQPLRPGDLRRQLRAEDASATPAAPPPASASPGTAGSPTWRCVACTFVNSAARFKLSCEVCGTRRSAPTPASPPRAAAVAVVDLLSQSSDDSDGDVVELATDATDAAAAAVGDAPWQFETQAAAALDAAPPLPPLAPVDDGDGDGDGDDGGDARAGDVRGLVALIGAPHRDDAALPPPPPPPAPQWSAPAFAVHARRQFLPAPGGGAPPASATGKSRFYIGGADAFGSVEELVMDRLRRFDVDELLHDAADAVDDDDDDARRAHVSALRRLRRLRYCQLFASSRPPAADATWRGDGWQGWHCEGALLRCLAGLLLWDVVFAPLPAVLLTRFQTAPLDYGSPSFFRRRRALVLRRVNELTHGALAQPAALLAEIRRLFAAHRGCVARHLGGLLNPAAGADADGTGGVSLRLLQLLALCLGPPCLGRLCLALAASQSQWRSGAPDLLLLRVSAEAASGDRFVLPLETLLGAHWQRLSARAPERRSAAADADWADDFCAPPQRFGAAPSDAAATAQRRHRRSGAGDAAADVPLPSLEPAVGGGGGGGGDEDADDDLARPLRLPRAVEGCAIVFEALLVEVKGPTDALAYKQWLWLQLLNLRVRPPSSSPADDASFDCYAPAHDLRGGRALFDGVAADGTADGAMDCAYEQRPVVAFVGLVREQRASAAAGDEAPQKPPRRRRAPADASARSKKARRSASPAVADADAAATDELVAFDFADDGDDWRPADA